MRKDACRFCGTLGWYTCGHHGCPESDGKLLGLHGHRKGDEKHLRCTYCGAQWIER